MSELYKKYRPSKFKDVLGQLDAARSLNEMVKKRQVPHTILFIGPSGCGKTTLARILVNKLKASPSDVVEMNSSNYRGIDSIRDIQNRISLAPVAGDCRIWIMDECHQLTGAAQDAFLKILEDTPEHVYFFLATTDPAKLKKTIKTRATEIRVNLLDNETMKKLLDSVIDKERLEVSDLVVDRIIEYSEGSARKGLVLLNHVISVTDEDRQLELVVNSNDRAVGFEIAQMLFNKSTKWKDIASKLKTLGDEPETVRHIVMSYAETILLNSGNGFAFSVMNIFCDPFFNNKRKDLTMACFEVLNMER